MSKSWFFPRGMFLVAGLLLASACTAQPDAIAPYTEGNEYVTLPAPYQRFSKDGKVEVVEVFSYGCVHCAQFAPLAEKLRQSLPAGATFKLVAAPLSAEWLPYARAWYAADKLGVVQRTHLPLFEAKFIQQYPINSMDELADFYAKHGVNRAKFMQLATSPEATATLKRDLALLQHWQVDGTPALVVNGKYKVANVRTLEEMTAVALWLTKRELAQKK